MNLKSSILTLGFIIFTMPLLAQFTADVTSGCDTLTVSFADQTGSSTWSWDFGDGNTLLGNATPVHHYSDTGLYTVIMVVDAGTFTKDIIVHKSPDVDFDTTTVYYASFSVIFRNTTTLYSPAMINAWNFGDGSANDTIFEKLYKYDQEGLYTVKLVVKDAYGCTDSTAKNINVKHQFIIPNAFTPNGDNVNDQFIVLANGLDIFPEANFYNRWGTLVFRKQAVTQVVWDGRTFDGTPVASGTYFYVITLPENSLNAYPSDKNIKGSIQVLFDRKSLK